MLWPCYTEYPSWYPSEYPKYPSRNSHVIPFLIRLWECHSFHALKWLTNKLCFCVFFSKLSFIIIIDYLGSIGAGLVFWSPQNKFLRTTKIFPTLFIFCKCLVLITVYKFWVYIEPESFHSFTLLCGDQCLAPGEWFLFLVEIDICFHKYLGLY